MKEIMPKAPQAMAKIYTLALKMASRINPQTLALQRHRQRSQQRQVVHWKKTSLRQLISQVQRLRVSDPIQVQHISRPLLLWD